jgi:hypothetical protein
MACRSTVKKQAFCGRPFRQASQLSPASRDRQTAAAASGGYRPAESLFKGRVHSVSGLPGCTAMGNPKVDGSPSVMSSQLRPPSRDRQTPWWFC